MKAWNIWMDKYNPHINKSDYYAPYGLQYCLRRNSDNQGSAATISRAENIMNQATHLDMEITAFCFRELPSRPARMTIVRSNKMNLVQFERRGVTSCLATLSPAKINASRSDRKIMSSGVRNAKAMSPQWHL